MLGGLYDLASGRVLEGISLFKQLRHPNGISLIKQLRHPVYKRDVVFLFHFISGLY